MHCQFGFGGVGSMGNNVRKKATSDTLPKPGKVNSGTIIYYYYNYYYYYLHKKICAEQNDDDECICRRLYT